MKKVISLMLLLLLLTGCCDSSKNCEQDLDNYENWHYVIVYKEQSMPKELGQQEHHIELEENVLAQIKPLTWVFEAVKIGFDIINELHKMGVHPDCSLLGIYHYTEDNVWHFGYGIDKRYVDDPSDLIGCGELDVVIDGNTGELILAWVSE